MKIVFKFIRNFLLGFLLTWYAIDMWKLFHGDLRPLWRKGINIEWLVNTKWAIFQILSMRCKETDAHMLVSGLPIPIVSLQL